MDISDWYKARTCYHCFIEMHSDKQSSIHWKQHHEFLSNFKHNFAVILKFNIEVHTKYIYSLSPHYEDLYKCLTSRHFSKDYIRCYIKQQHSYLPHLPMQPQSLFPSGMPKNWSCQQDMQCIGSNWWRIWLYGLALYTYKQGLITTMSDIC